MSPTGTTTDDDFIIIEDDFNELPPVKKEEETTSKPIFDDQSSKAIIDDDDSFHLDFSSLKSESDNDFQLDTEVEAVKTSSSNLDLASLKSEVPTPDLSHGNAEVVEEEAGFSLDDSSSDLGSTEDSQSDEQADINSILDTAIAQLEKREGVLQNMKKKDLGDIEATSKEIKDLQEKKKEKEEDVKKIDKEIAKISENAKSIETMKLSNTSSSTKK